MSATDWIALAALLVAVPGAILGVINYLEARRPAIPIVTARFVHLGGRPEDDMCFFTVQFEIMLVGAVSDCVLESVSAIRPVGTKLRHHGQLDSGLYAPFCNAKLSENTPMMIGHWQMQAARKEPAGIRLFFGADKNASTVDVAFKLRFRGLGPQGFDGTTTIRRALVTFHSMPQ